MVLALAIVAYAALLAALVYARRRRPAPVEHRSTSSHRSTPTTPWVVPPRVVDKTIADLEQYLNGARS